MSALFLLLIIGLSVAVGCYVGQKHLFTLSEHQKSNPRFSKEYFTGLNYLLNEQPDKAVDVFTRLLQIDSDTVETHLALGSLFRRRGEIGRAIKIHQNLIARSQLPKQQRIAALIALGKDYLHAGLIDRAEKLFLGIISIGDEFLISLHYLLAIYQQQKNWVAAIKIAQQLNALTDEPLHIAIAHYHCELAQRHKIMHETDTAVTQLKLALKKDSHCVRANLLLANIFFELKQYQDAINALKEILHQDKIFFKEALPVLFASYKALDQVSTCVEFLSQPGVAELNIDIVFYLTDSYQDSAFAHTQKEVDYLNYLTLYLKKFPSLKGLHHFLVYQEKNFKKDFSMLIEIVNNILKTLPQYCCGQCGFKSHQLIWLCPGCKNWSQIKPVAY